MKLADICRSIFSLAIRLLGLVFLYRGLTAMPPLLDFQGIEQASVNDLITAVLPIVFNLAVAWWLIGSKLLTRRAYPEESRMAAYSNSPMPQAEPVSKPGASREMADLDTAERKLAALVGKPKNNPSA
jgi:hypothetical protein